MIKKYFASCVANLTDGKQIFSNGIFNLESEFESPLLENPLNFIGSLNKCFAKLLEQEYKRVVTHIVILNFQEIK